tara:strand:+ start:261 stop:401 length:141 start_codon:yes stop_codon:yes gene_type:complete
VLASECFTIADLMDLPFDGFLIVRDEVEKILTRRNAEMKKVTRRKK